MSRFFNVRGFLDCDFEELRSVKSIVGRYRNLGAKFGLTDEIGELYSAGWLYQEREINWTAHAFFGASMRIQGVEFVLAQITRIAEELPGIEGMFLIDDDESSESLRWDVASGVVRIAQGHQRS
jgi:hypothetical protein